MPEPLNAVTWVEPAPAWMARAANAVALGDGRVFVFDPFDDGTGEAEQRVRALGPVAGVVQLLDRHQRDCAAWARRFGVPHHVVPRGGLPFELIDVLRIPRVWSEAAAWLPETGTLVVADVLANAPGYRAAGEPLGVHPFLRMVPPRALGRLPVEHLLLGHGPALHGEAARTALADALRTSRRNAPRFAVDQVRRVLGRT